VSCGVSCQARKVRDDMRDNLRREKIIITELEPVNETHVDRYSIWDLAEDYEWVMLIINDTILTLLLMLMMLGTRNPRTPERMRREKSNPHSMTVIEKIESSIRNYIMLKSFVSAITGACVGVSLMVLDIRLWFVWGVLTFIFNFIPNVGSLIAMVLPLSVILVDDISLERKMLAFLIPAIIQGYVGNVLEPVLFGKSLNLTAISVFLALVFWGSLWGLPGAILSVPLLGAMKILLDAADYPLAKQILYIIKEDNSIEELVEAPGFDKTDGTDGEEPRSFMDRHVTELRKGALANPAQEDHSRDWIRQYDGGHIRADMTQDLGKIQAEMFQMESATSAMSQGHLRADLSRPSSQAFDQSTRQMPLAPTSQGGSHEGSYMV
jgi:hypothetical protein